MYNMPFQSIGFQKVNINKIKITKKYDSVIWDRQKDPVDSCQPGLN